jgi:hypothetical protein
MEQQVMYRFSKMELEQFAMFEENCDPETTEVQFHTEAEFSYDKNNSVICSKIIVIMSHQEKPLVKAELNSYFDIHPKSLKSLYKDGNIVFTPPMLVQFASLCYGSIRGVIFAKTLGTSLNSYIVPPVYFGNMIDKGFIVEE